MPIEVRLLPPAERDLDEAFRWAARQAPENAARWATRFKAKLQSLERHPARYGLAPEHRKVKRDLSQMLFGRRPNVFREVFIIEGEVVKILRIRRASRRSFTRKQLGEELDG